MSRGGVLVHPAIQRRKPLTARVGVLGVGLDIYWSQFPGLLETLLGYLDTFEQKVQAWNVETTSFGMVDNATAAYALLSRCRPCRSWSFPHSRPGPSARTYRDS